MDPVNVIPYPGHRRRGDRWGLVAIKLDTGKEGRVQIGGWETSTFPYRKQAEEYAQGYNELSQQHNWNERYEARYAGNMITREGPGMSWR
jgi:hypothetical protein